MTMLFLRFVGQRFLVTFLSLAFSGVGLALTFKFFLLFVFFCRFLQLPSVAIEANDCCMALFYRFRSVKFTFVNKIFLQKVVNIRNFIVSLRLNQFV